MKTCTLTIQGARGTRTAVGPSFARYGARTSCYSLETEQGFLVFDTGTGVRNLSKTCMESGPGKPIAIFFSHFHFDHTIGLSEFEPIYHPGFEVQFHGVSPSSRHRWPDLLQDLFDEPYYPVPLRRLPATIGYQDLDQLTQPLDLHGAKIAWRELVHTQRCLGFRVTTGERSIVILTDHEPQLATTNEVAEFSSGADVLIMDAQYLPEEYADHCGWGHGTWQDATRLATRAGVKKLLLCHHDPDRTDDALEDILRRAREVFPQTEIACEQMSLKI